MMIVKAGLAAVILAGLVSPVLADNAAADQREAAQRAHCLTVAHSNEMAFESCVSGHAANPKAWVPFGQESSLSRQASGRATF
jgi:hypothetical protein